MRARPEPSPSALVDAMSRQFMARRPVRTGSLIVTLFGDSVAPRGGEVWLGSLITVLGNIGISERMVRSAVFRLTQDGTLHNELVGRRSYYRLTHGGREQFEAATRRIYAGGGGDWDGRWTLVLLGALDADTRTSLRKTLTWLGFGTISADLLAHPAAEVEGLSACLDGMGLAGQVPVMRATLDEDSGAALAPVVAKAWDIEALEHAYAEFIGAFAPVDAAIRGARRALGDRESFLLRTFLVHRYRRVLLRDPGLPDALLPEGWHGGAAHVLASRLYRRIARPAERYVDAVFMGRDGPLPPADASFEGRFGGLGG